MGTIDISTFVEEVVNGNNSIIESCNKTVDTAKTTVSAISDLPQIVKNWSETNSARYLGGLESHEFSMYANTKNGNHTNSSFYNKETSTSRNVTNLLAEKAIKEMNGDIQSKISDYYDSYFHSHPNTTVATPSLKGKDLSTFFKDKLEGIQKEFIVSMNEILEIDLSKITNEQFENLLNQSKYGRFSTKTV